MKNKSSFFNNILVSCPNEGGGIFIIHEGRAIKLDSYQSTGLAIAGEILVRGEQPGTIWYKKKHSLKLLENSAAFQDVHDVLIHKSSLYIVGTEKNAITKLNLNGEVLQTWVFPGEFDSMHINCLAAWNKRIVFSAFGDFRNERGYKKKTYQSGFIQDLITGDRIISGLSQPHSMIQFNENMLVANSELMQLREYSLDGSLLRSKKFSGYTRGIALRQDVIFIGLSSSRNVINEKLNSARIVAIDSKSWKIIAELTLPSKEIYSIHIVESDKILVNLISSIAEKSNEINCVNIERISSRLKITSDELIKSNQVYSDLKNDTSEKFARLSESLSNAQNSLIVMESESQEKMNALEEEHRKQLAQLNALISTERESASLVEYELQDKLRISEHGFRQELSQLNLLVSAERESASSLQNELQDKLRISEQSFRQELSQLNLLVSAERESASSLQNELQDKLRETEIFYQKAIEQSVRDSDASTRELIAGIKQSYSHDLSQLKKSQEQIIFSLNHKQNILLSTEKRKLRVALNAIVEAGYLLAKIDGLVTSKLISGSAKASRPDKNKINVIRSLINDQLSLFEYLRELFMENYRIEKAENITSLLAYTGEAFVICAYLTILNRTPDPGGLKFYLSELCSGVSKVDVICQIACSKEAKERNEVPEFICTVVKKNKNKKNLIAAFLGLFGSRQLPSIELRLNSIEHKLGELRKNKVIEESCLEQMLSVEPFVFNTINEMTKAEELIEESNPLVTFVMPVYDRTHELNQAILSVLNQNFYNYELIIVTDGSPKETIDTLEYFNNNHRIKIFNYPVSSGNAVRGRNKGILESKGKYIAFLDSDDIATKDRMILSLPLLESGDADIVYGSWIASIDGTREVAGVLDGQIIESPDCDFEMLKNISVPCQSTVVVRKSLFYEYGFLKHIMKYREDHELWARFSFFGAKFKPVKEPLVQLKLHAGNNELNFIDEDQKWKEKVTQQYFIKGDIPKKIAFILPGVGISGGIAVVLRHASMLIDSGHDVMVINIGVDSAPDWFTGNKAPIIHFNDQRQYLFDNIDILIATGWNTAEWLNKIQSKRKLYFVQSDERRFVDDLESKNRIESTYRMNCEYLTEARWIIDLLRTEFNQKAYYVPNGLDQSFFYPLEEKKKAEKSKVRVLIEGPICIPFKGMKEAYSAISELDCEIWIVSSAGKPPADWRYDKYFEAVPMAQMREIYANCDILLKMSRVEGFFGPPMEAMACGCAVVVSEVTGWDEYIVNGKNALVVGHMDVDGARSSVQQLIEDVKLRSNLVAGGLETVKNWTWERSHNAMLSVISSFSEKFQP
jgi:glycosyltransferase involved in cell wall biosynthesis